MRYKIFFEKKHRKGIKTLAVESLFTSISIGNLCGKFPYSLFMICGGRCTSSNDRGIRFWSVLCKRK